MTIEPQFDTAYNQQQLPHREASRDYASKPNGFFKQTPFSIDTPDSNQRRLNKHRLKNNLPG